MVSNGYSSGSAAGAAAGTSYPLQLLRLIEVDAVRRIDRVAAQVADARENEQPDQHHGQQRDQKRAAQRPFVAVGKNTHR